MRKIRRMICIFVRVKFVVFPYLTDYNREREIFQGGDKVLKTELEIVTVGEPDIKALPEFEQRTFFETLLAKIKELSENNE